MVKAKRRCNCLTVGLWDNGADCSRKERDNAIRDSRFSWRHCCWALLRDYLSQKLCTEVSLSKAVPWVMEAFYPPSDPVSSFFRPLRIYQSESCVAMRGQLTHTLDPQDHLNLSEYEDTSLDSIFSINLVRGILVGIVLLVGIIRSLHG